MIVVATVIRLQIVKSGYVYYSSGYSHYNLGMFMTAMALVIRMQIVISNYVCGGFGHYLSL